MNLSCCTEEQPAYASAPCVDEKRKPKTEEVEKELDSSDSNDQVFENDNEEGRNVDGQAFFDVQAEAIKGPQDESKEAIDPAVQRARYSEIDRKRPLDVLSEASQESCSWQRRS